jgi:hypothetical protein
VAVLYRATSTPMLSRRGCAESGDIGGCRDGARDSLSPSWLTFFKSFFWLCHGDTLFTSGSIHAVEWSSTRWSITGPTGAAGFQLSTRRMKNTVRRAHLPVSKASRNSLLQSMAAHDGFL